jgi:hypothetical protein
VSVPELPAGFEGLSLPSYREHARSPRLEPEAPGLALAAPGRIDLTLHDALPVLGTILVPATFAIRFGSLVGSVALVVVDLETHRACATRALRVDGPPPATRLDPSEPFFDERMLGSWFNVDLFDVAPELRRRGRVLAYAFIGELVSNPVEIRIEGRP